MAQQKHLGDPLTHTEIKVIRLIAQGYRNQGIADQLGIAPSTVHKHVQNIMTSLGLRSRTQVAIHALKIGLISLEDIDLVGAAGRLDGEGSFEAFNDFLTTWCPPARRQLLRRIVYRLVYGRSGWGAEDEANEAPREVEAVL